MTSEAKFLVIGNGAREDAIVQTLQNKNAEVFIAPGNGSRRGIHLPISASNTEELIKFAKSQENLITIIGPEGPLADGIVDKFRDEDLKIVGPTKEAALLESSKLKGLEFMEKYDIPHPTFQSFDNKATALKFLESPPWEKLVIKEDGLKAGKGVYLPSSIEEAREIIKNKFQDGETIVLQERLYGPEASSFAFIYVKDGKAFYVYFTTAQDHKRLKDGDVGPNTGGMGAYAPVELSSENMQIIKDNIFQKTVDGLLKENLEYVGFLFAGLMMTNTGPVVLEYNARLGDPETQVILPLLESDLGNILEKLINGTLKPEDVQIRRGKVAVGVVLAAENYPENPIKGDVIEGIDNIPSDILVSQAGTKMDQEETLTTDGGRILTVVSVEDSIDEARKNVYEAIGHKGIHFRGMQYRADIAKKN